MTGSESWRTVLLETYLLPSNLSEDTIGSMLPSARKGDLEATWTMVPDHPSQRGGGD